MFRKLVISAATFAVAFVIVAVPASAQRTSRTKRTQQSSQSMAVSPYAGYMTFGELVDGPLNTTLKSKASPIYGVQLNLPLGNTVSVFGNVGYTEPDLSVGLPLLGSITFGKSAVWLYDAGLQLSAPGYGSGDRGIVPFVQVGAGAMKYDVDVSGFSRSATNTAFNAGLGVDIPFAQNIGLRLVAKDYIGKFDFQEATQVDIVDAKTSHNVALSAGLKLVF
ncbi:MAG: outer membrane beta-barrel protein [Gemmatimonadaceae bacterium]